MRINQCLPQALRARINEVADRLFAPFSKRVGVASIREWEEQHAAFEQDVATRRTELQQQVQLVLPLLPTIATLHGQPKLLARNTSIAFLRIPKFAPCTSNAQEAKLEGQLGYERGRNLADLSDQRKEEVNGYLK